MKITLDATKLLGFRICGETSQAINAKNGAEAGVKVDAKVGSKLGSKGGIKAL